MQTIFRRSLWREVNVRFFKSLYGNQFTFSQLILYQILVSYSRENVVARLTESLIAFFICRLFFYWNSVYLLVVSCNREVTELFLWERTMISLVSRCLLLAHMTWHEISWRHRMAHSVTSPHFVLSRVEWAGGESLGTRLDDDQIL